MSGSSVGDCRNKWNFDLGSYVVVSAVSILVAVVWSHAIAVVLQVSLFSASAMSLNAWPLSVASGVLSLTLVCLSARLNWQRSGPIVGLVVGLFFIDVYPGAWAEFITLFFMGLGLAFGIHYSIHILLERAGSLPHCEPIRAIAWALLCVMCLIQFARLTTFITDPQIDWFLSTRHVGWAKHECLPAYLYGAELAIFGESNIYDPLHYPGLNPQAVVQTQIKGMRPEDPFQYTPLFLLIPYVALKLSSDYAVLRVVWFAFQSTYFVVVVVILGVWVGGKRGRVALWRTPLLLSSFPVLSNLQFGQFHGFTLCLALMAMLAIEHKWNRIGGVCLAIAMASKIFPGLLMLILAKQRRWEPLFWTIGTLMFASCLTFLIFGASPFVAFVGDHLPRLATGEAFAFGDAWPDLRTLVIGANHGFYGLVMKLGELGFPGASTELARWINRACGVALIGLALWCGARHGEMDRGSKVMSWLGLLGLASLLSTGAFVDYVSIPALWLLTYMVPACRDREGERHRRHQWWIWWIVFFIHYFMIGGAPIGTFEDPEVLLPISSVSALLLMLTLVYPFWAKVDRRSMMGGMIP